MTNEEIYDEARKNGMRYSYDDSGDMVVDFVACDALMNLARADEREKIKAEFSIIADEIEDEAKDFVEQYILQQPQGVDAWVSWSNIHNYSDPQISVNKPIELDDMNGKAYSHYGVKSTENVTCTCPDLIAKLLNISPGECAKFKIVRVEE